MINEVDRRGVRALVDRGAQLVDVLDPKEFDDSHLPGAINIPAPKLAELATKTLDPSRPTIVYCYDVLCDLSPRAAWRLETLGFTDVYDYVASKMDWLGAGWPFEGARADQPHLAALAEAVPTCALGDRTADLRDVVGDAAFCVVVDDRRIVLGLVRAEALAVDAPIADVLQEAPKTARPHVSTVEMVDELDKSPQPWILVTNLDGTLVGFADPDYVRRVAERERGHAG